MEASIVDLRYRMNDILKALERNEDVRILCRGKLKGVIKAQKDPVQQKITEHPFFNMFKESQSVQEQMDRLRGGRYRDI